MCGGVLASSGSFSSHGGGGFSGGVKDFGLMKI
jgi:hypothetical protein